jgi:predicted glycosyltransferase
MKPLALLYCQHSLGLGHFVRSLLLAEALTAAFDLVFINGGPVPRDFDLPASVHFAHMPPLRMLEDGSLAGDGDVDAILADRRERMLALVAERTPALLIVELYPFGRKKFAPELDPLIAAVRACGGKIACSVRDILVNERADQARHDERAARCLNQAFDAVLVHADERMARLGDSFKPATPLAIPVHHTGFVAKLGSASASDPDGPTLVTAGGGIVGHALYRAALEGQPMLWARRRWPMMLVAGPFFPEPDWQALVVAARDIPGITLARAVPSMKPLLQRAGRIASQCGYNSALEIVQNCKPALFVPFARGQESEQTVRAMQLQALGLADWTAEEGLDGANLAERLLALRRPVPAILPDFNGAAKSAAILKALVA